MRSHMFTCSTACVRRRGLFLHEGSETLLRSHLDRCLEVRARARAHRCISSDAEAASTCDDSHKRAEVVFAVRCEEMAWDGGPGPAADLLLRRLRPHGENTAAQMFFFFSHTQTGARSLTAGACGGAEDLLVLLSAEDCHEDS